MNSRSDVREKYKVFADGLLRIEAEHLDYVLEHGRLQDSCRLVHVEATNKQYFCFINDSMLPEEIKTECTDLFASLFPSGMKTEALMFLRG